MLIKVSLMLLLGGVVYLMPPAYSFQVNAQSRKGHYTCPMHPDVIKSKPGRCPKCQMVLRYTKAKAEEKSTKPETSKPADPSAVSSLRIPDVIIQDQNGKSLNFYNDLVKGKVVAINFVFTTCTAICPSLTATFRRVQQQLAEQPFKAQLISISVDPTVDTPERLHDFAAKFKAEPGWTFVTGSAADIDSLLKEFGVAVANKNDHTPMILIGNDEAGYWTRAYGLSSPTSLVRLITEASKRK
jgi:protein SCO1